MGDRSRILVLVHPGSACGSADFNLGVEAAALRDALAGEIMSWPHDLLVVDGTLSDELDHYANLGLAVRNAQDRTCRRFARVRACDDDGAHWPDLVVERFDAEWPDGPHEVIVTGAWIEESGRGCVGAVAAALADHSPAISGNALRLP